MIFDEISDDSSEGLILDPLPPMTNSKTLCKCGCFTCRYVPDLRSHFLNEWEVSMGFPLVVLSIIISSYVVWIFCVAIPGQFGVFSYVITTMLMLLYLGSYLMTIYVGPGYLPFYFPIKSPTNNPLTGLVVNSLQENYVLQQPRLAKTSFCRTAHRIVIRPDHFCGWTQTFIGKKNHKLFFLFNFWGVCYILNFLVTDLLVIVASDGKSRYIAVDISYAVVAFFFLIMQFSFIISLISNMFVDMTQLDKMKKKSPVSRARSWSGVYEVFGSPKRWWSWLLPIPAFPKMTDVQLAYSGAQNDIYL